VGKSCTILRVVPQRNCLSINAIELAGYVLRFSWGLPWLSQRCAWGEYMERRAKRFPLCLPTTVRRTTGSGTTEAKTESRDVSSRGIYFFLSEQIEDGSPVEIVINLPHEIALGGRSRVLCKGYVQRTEVIKVNRIGVAARIESYEFLQGNEKERRFSTAKA